MKLSSFVSSPLPFSVKNDSSLVLAIDKKPIVFTINDMVVYFAKKTGETPKDVVLIPRGDQAVFVEWIKTVDEAIKQVVPSPNNVESVGYFYEKLGKYGVRVKWNRFAEMKSMMPNVPPKKIVGIAAFFEPHVAVMKVTFSLAGWQAGNDGRLYLNKWMKEMVVPVDASENPVMLKDLYVAEEEDLEYMASLNK